MACWCSSCSFFVCGVSTFYLAEKKNCPEGIKGRGDTPSIYFSWSTINSTIWEWVSVWRCGKVPECLGHMVCPQLRRGSSHRWELTAFRTCRRMLWEAHPGTKWWTGFWHRSLLEGPHLCVRSLPGATSDPAPTSCQVWATAHPPRVQHLTPLDSQVLCCWFLWSLWLTTFGFWGTHFMQKMVKTHG